MAEEFAEIALSIGADAATDDEELSRLSEGLREDLMEAGAESVEQVPGGEAPPGSKGDLITLGNLLVTLAPTALAGLIAMLKSWTTRHERVKITLTRGKEKITIAGDLSQEQQRTITAWLRAGKGS
jgi:hypothetical protein